MQITQERLEELQTVILRESSVSFIETDKSFEKNDYWYITNDDVGEQIAPKGESDWDYKTRSKDSFLKWVEGKDVKANTIIYREGVTGYDEENFKEWEHLARYLGVSTLVALSTKVPQSVVRKFKYFASSEGTASEVIRGLIYNYVQEQIKLQSQKLMFSDVI